MKKKVFLIFIVFGFALSKAFSQGYRIEATLKGLRDSACVLGHYSYTNTSFVAKDTAMLDAAGKVVFQGKAELPGGLYLILFPDKTRWVEVVYSGKETHFSLSADTTDLEGTMVVKGSEENRLFYEFNKRARTLSREIEALDKNHKATQDKAVKDDLERKIVEKQKQFKAVRDQFISDNKETFAARFISASRAPDVSNPPKLKDGSEDRNWVYNYYKTHFWDGFDFQDERLLRTPLLRPKLEQYFRNLVVQVPDSICKEADRLIARAEGARDMKTYLVYFVTSEYENSKVIGTEPVFVRMAEKYYLTGQMELSEDGLKRVKERVAIAKPLLPGKVIPNMTLSDTLKRNFTLHGIKADYIVLYLYSPSCSHCKESVPKLRAFFDKNKSLGVKVLMVPTEESPEEWKKFIHTYKVTDMMHGYDYAHAIPFRNQFDVYSTPTVYFLDKDKRIITRKVPTDELDGFFAFHRKKMEEEKSAKAVPAGK